MSRNYKLPDVDLRWWARAHETHIAIATAIFAIARGERTPSKIWEDPTPEEEERIKSLLVDYIARGDFPEERSGIYDWGSGEIDLGICRDPVIPESIKELLKPKLD
jgi:hypothetical protein